MKPYAYDLHGISAKTRPGLWWKFYRRDVIGVLSLVALVGIYCLVSRWDLEDALDLQTARADHAEEALAREKAIASLPDPAIIISARTAQEYGMRLSEIAGGADKQRMEMKGRK